jgi:hypothetical protein
MKHAIELLRGQLAIIETTLVTNRDAQKSLKAQLDEATAAGEKLAATHAELSQVLLQLKLPPTPPAAEPTATAQPETKRNKGK